MPFVPDPIFKSNQATPPATGFQPLATTTPGFMPDTNSASTQSIPQPAPGSLLNTIGQSSLNPVRDLTSFMVGFPMSQLSPSVKGADVAAQRARQTQQKAIAAGVPPEQTGTPGLTGQQVLQQGGALPTSNQVIGSTAATASLFLPGGSKVLQQLGSDAVQGFGLTYGTALQNNASQGDAIQQGLWGALINMGLGLAGKGIKASWNYLVNSLPERLYSPTFRQTSEDILSEARAKAAGQPTKTLARKALEAGVNPGGSNELVSVVKSLNDTETQLQKVVSSKGAWVNIGNRQPYINFLEQVKQTYSGGFMSDKATQAQDFINVLKSSRFAGGQGDIPADTALDLKRFIDNMRNTSSFRLDPNLNAKQEQFKAGADALRKALRKQIPGVNDLLDKEQQFIQFADAMASEAARRGNAQIFNLFDAIVGGESMGAGAPFTGIGLDALLRTAQQPTVRGKIAQGLFKVGQVAGSTPAVVGDIAAPIGRTLSAETSAATAP